MRRRLIALAMLVLTAGVARAEDSGLIVPSDPVVGQPSLTYRDLLRLVIPDLDEGDGVTWTGHLKTPIPHIDGPDAAGDVPDPVTIQYLDVKTILSDGQPTLWLAADLGDGGALGTYTLLAAFTDSPSPTLIDAVEVDSDRETGFLGDPLRISDKDEAMVVDSEHSNSDQTYQAETLVFLNKGQLTPIGTFLAFGTRSCTYTQYETLKLTSEAGTSSHWPVTATIARQVASQAQSDDCPEPKDSDFKTTNFVAVYTWNAKTGRYETKSQEMDRLSEADQKLD